MKNTTNTVRTISEIGIIAALGFVFDELQGILWKGVFINGGSIGFAMVAVLIMAYRRGLLPALLTGFIMGLLDIMTSAYILHPVQLLLDYIFPYALVGLVGLLKPFYDHSKDKASKVLWLISGAIIGGLLKFLSHFLSGAIFFADATTFAWNLNNMNPYLYSFVYNIAFMGPCIILSGALLVAIELTAPRLLIVKNQDKKTKKENDDLYPKVLSIITIAVGAFLFIFFFVKYIMSFSSWSEDGASGYDFDPDSMLIFVLGLLISALGVISLIKSVKNRFDIIPYLGVSAAISLTSFIYGLARLRRAYIKDDEVHIPTYWIWFAISLTVLIIFVFLFFYSIIRSRKKKN